MARYGFIHDKLDIKFLVLYLTARLAGPVDFATLTDLTMCDAGVDYFDFAEAVSELVKTGHLALEDGCYSITEKGRRDAQVRGEVLERDEGGFTARLTLDDESGNLLSVELFSPVREQAERLCENFKSRPERFYNAVLEALMEQGDGE